jgi:hypothetical protein
MEQTPLLRSPRAIAKLALGFFGILIATSSFAASMTLTPNADAELRQASPLGVFGSGTTMVSGGLGSNAGNTLRRSLLRFELADAIPSGASITAVELTVQVVLMVPPSPVSSNFELHRLLRPWRESAVTWTWADNPISPWGTGGAGRDDDALPTGSASVFVSGLGQYVFESTPELVADVQLWVDDPSSNAGWLLRSDTESPFTARHFGTRENASNPARLTIVYEVAVTPDPVTIGELTIQENINCNK